MSSFYTYFISSLPMLHFGQKPPFSYERFLEMCRDLISERDNYILSNIPIKRGDFNPSPENDTIKKWLNFDTTLRNELVKIRSQHKHIDPTKYLREIKDEDFSIVHIATAAHRATSILEAEKILDQARWQALDDIEIGHYFDSDFLIVYGYKLKLLLRWEGINTADKAGVLEQALQKI